jgi:hypothetical protein
MRESDEVETVTAEMVVQKRLKMLTFENNALVLEMMEYQERIKEIQYRMAEIAVEEELLEKSNKKNIYTYIKETVTVETQAEHVEPMAMDFDQALKDVLDNFGRPARMKEIIVEMEKYGFQWNTYPLAHQRITRSGLVENAGMRGIYQKR